ncbi:MAG: MFS transporter [Tepidisphaeraceae bacterium]
MPTEPALESASPPLHRDATLLVFARCLRLFAYGLLSAVIVFYLAAVGIDEKQIGLLLTLTLIGDTAISLFLTSRADRIGRRLTLIVGAGLMLVAGVVFASTGNYLLLLITGIVGVISPSGKEVGPFLSVEQAALSHVITGTRRTSVFAWMNLAGSFSGAIGVLLAGGLAAAVHWSGGAPVVGYRTIIIVYAVIGLALAAVFLRLGREVEWTPADGDAPTAMRFGLSAESRPVVLRLAGLFVIDAFAGGFVIDGLTIYWFHTKFGVGLGVLGWVYFATNVVAGLSGLWAARLAKRFGLINTMVFTHLPSNVLLILVPLMPNLPSAAAVLFLRFCISQMDVPTRQAYTMAIVRPNERSAAAGITGTARTIGAALAPVLATQFYSRPALAALPFFIAGGLKIVYDLLLYRAFVAHETETETAAAVPGK